jgi:SAM-dependent methyltransferase
MPDAVAPSRHWADQLAAWAIPSDILDQAPQSPWLLPLALFQVPDDPDARRAEPSRSDLRALEALPEGGSVLDIGCGGGRAAFAIAPPAAIVIGVDEKPYMLESFAAAAQARGLQHRELRGNWPELSAGTPIADLVTCHHVAYNVPDLGPFAQALGRHARRRVVMELSWRHPLARLSPLWQRFWQLQRPAGPSAEDAAELLRAIGLPVRLERWSDTGPARDAELTVQQQVEIARIRLCLTPDRDPEVAEALADLGPLQPREVATLWWDS